MRVLISTTAGEGHVRPLIPLARALAARGHEVVWAAPDEAHGTIRAAGMHAETAGWDTGACFAELARRFPAEVALPPRAAGAAVFPRLFGDVAAPAAAPALATLLDDWWPDLVLHEPAELAAPALAAARGLRVVTHGFGLGLRAALRREAAERAAAALGMPVAPVDVLLLDLCPPSLRLPELAHPGPRLAVRPEAVVAPRGTMLPPEVEAVLQAGRPVVHLTAGTLLHDPARLGALARALAELDVGVVVAGTVDDVPGEVAVAAHLPYALLLNRVDVVVSQAGAGVLLQGLAAGAAQLCLPQAASDQFRNAAACEAAGAGLALEDPTPSQAAGAVARLLGEPAFRARARAIAREIAEMPSPAAVAAAL